MCFSKRSSDPTCKHRKRIRRLFWLASEPRLSKRSKLPRPIRSARRSKHCSNGLKKSANKERSTRLSKPSSESCSRGRAKKEKSARGDRDSRKSQNGRPRQLASGSRQPCLVSNIFSSFSIFVFSFGSFHQNINTPLLHETQANQFITQRLCPLLNGTMKADNGAAEHGGFGNYNAPAGNAGSPG